MSISDIAPNTYSDKPLVVTEQSAKSAANLDAYRLGESTLDVVRNLASDTNTEGARNHLPSLKIESGASLNNSERNAVEASTEATHVPWKAADFCSQRLNDLQKAGDLDPLLRITAGMYVAGSIDGNLSPENKDRLRGLLIKNGADITKIDAIIAEGNDLKAHGQLEVLPGFRK